MVSILPTVQQNLRVKEFVQVHTANISMRQALNQGIAGLTFRLYTPTKASELSREDSFNNVIGKEMESLKDSVPYSFKKPTISPKCNGNLVGFFICKI